MGSNPRLKAKSTMNFDDFTDKLYVLLKASWGKDWGVFTGTHPTTTDSKNIKFPQIVYNLISLEPAKFGKDNVIERRARLRETLENENSFSEVYGQIFDIKVIFYIYGDSNKSVNDIAKNFRGFIFESTPYLKSQGLSQIFFNKEYYSDDRSNETYAVRCLEYSLRIEEGYEVNQDLLKEIFIQADILHEESEKNNELPSQNNI